MLSRILQAKFSLPPQRLLQANFSVYSKLQKELTVPEKISTVEKFQFPRKTHSINDIAKNYSNLKDNQINVTVHGWIDSKIKKISKKLLFANFRDTDDGNIIQIIVNNEELVKKINKFRVEDAVAISGTIEMRHMKGDEAGQAAVWDLKVSEVQNLNHASVIASQLESLKKSSPFDFPPEYRYLQLRQPEFQTILKKRSLAANTIRSELIDQGFVEVETPLLFKSTPEGAREFLVPTRRKNAFYALPQSPQQYKQLLMASGVPKYFQIAKCFRDEDLRADRQPEFTQVDMEMAFATHDDVQNVIEKLICATWNKVRDLPIFVPVGDESLEAFDVIKHEHFPKLSYIDALTKYGIDKPDLRSTLKFQDVSGYFTDIENKDFPVVEACVLKNPPSDAEAFEKLVDTNNFKSRVPNICVIKTQEDLNECLKDIDVATVDESKIPELQSLLNLEIGDIVAFSTRAEFPYENPTPLGRFRQQAIDAYPDNWRRKINGQSLENKDIFVASWVINFPLFSPDEPETVPNAKYPQYDFDKLVSTHHPFTMLQLEDYDYLLNKADFTKIKGDHYDLVVNGVELGGGSRRIHDTDLQNYIFHNVLKIKEPEKLFGHLLKAFESGCPPHAGFAIGFDRMIAMLLGHASIRNVIAFPKNQSGSDVVVGSPSKVNDERLKDYKIKIR
ncbi:aspartate--tRNA ligase [Saccharomycopsis crataegensis]|uniref:Aspartate--tRNA ligase n=1 Tax=Saccharomycopsis crataegensis TaxID=43959 RepID=A0AAV5QW79_9ASCO|nr:aspartate--tRNA ligase [Saccharomycopsis crataegensis]